MFLRYTIHHHQLFLQQGKFQVVIIAFCQSQVRIRNVVDRASCSDVSIESWLRDFDCGIAETAASLNELDIEYSTICTSCIILELATGYYHIVDIT